LFSYPPPHGHLNDLPPLARESAKLAAAVDGIDFLVNNAAVDPVAPIEAYSIEEFLTVQTINAHAAFVLCQTLAPYMKRKRAGAIVSVMSVVLSGGWPEKVLTPCRRGPCSASPALWLANGPHNIRVNAVSPGAIPTEMEHKHYAANGRAAYDQWAISKQSLPFRSDIRDVADTVVYLLSPLSRFITGQELHVNGGMYMG
jgi:3-oxoacyl-[acyl-carrier protein] reductase